VALEIGAAAGDHECAEVKVTATALLSIATAAVSCASGCYLAHGRDAPAASERDASPGAADAGPGHDAGAPRTETDAGAPPLPPPPPLPDDEPDVGPDERPSDDPGAAEWLDPPRGFGVCCEVGEVVGLDDVTRQGSPPRVAWDGTEWGVTWADQASPSPESAGPPRTLFRRLDADARPTIGAVTVDEVGAAPTAMAYGNHRFGVVSVTGRFRHRPGRLFVIDRAGLIRDERAFPDRLGGVAIARHPAVHGWATVANGDDPEGDGTARAHLLVFDEALAELARRELEWVRTDGASSAIVASKSVLVVASGQPSAVIRTYTGASIEEVDATDVGPLGTELAGAAFRDTAVFAARDYGRGPLRTIVWDPFERRVVSPPQIVAPTRSGQGLGIAGDSVGGTLGICYPTGGGEGFRDPDALTFMLVGGDGAPIGAPVVIASGFRYVASCAVASAGLDMYVVAWWNAAPEEPRHSILAARVSVRR
jgi:hypothetical protein